MNAANTLSFAPLGFRQWLYSFKGAPPDEVYLIRTLLGGSKAQSIKGIRRRIRRVSGYTPLLALEPLERVYARWQEELNPASYRKSAQIIDFAGLASSAGGEVMKGPREFEGARVRLYNIADVVDGARGTVTGIKRDWISIVLERSGDKLQVHRSNVRVDALAVPQ